MIPPKSLDFDDIKEELKSRQKYKRERNSPLWLYVDQLKRIFSNKRDPDE